MGHSCKAYFSEYSKLIKEANEIISKLEKEHKSQLSCKKGCDLCCMDYSIFPVEYYAILENLRHSDFKSDEIYTEHDPKGISCVFLKNHACTIYKSRPLICRTHGLPLLYTNYDGEWELSTCELNFKSFNFEDFTSENTFSQDKFNSKLFLLNKKFISEFKEHNFNEFDLIPLKKLVDHF